jgi:hypothetical protein
LQGFRYLNEELIDDEVFEFYNLEQRWAGDVREGLVNLGLLPVDNWDSGVRVL